MQVYFPLPDGLPAPQDDGAAGHLTGMEILSIALPATDGTAIDLSRLPGRTVVYAYPKTGRPGQDMPDGWDSIPGARGCTPQACDFRDHFAELQAAGAHAVYGLSTQSSDYQREARARLHLQFEMLSDEGLALTRALRLPAFEAGGETLLKRFTLIFRDGRIETVFYPVFPPNAHDASVAAWLRNSPAAA
jgi:peroxiredoxin